MGKSARKEKSSVSDSSAGFPKHEAGSTSGRSSDSDGGRSGSADDSAATALAHASATVRAAFDPKGADVRPWQTTACQLFLLIVVLRLPFFEVPCGRGTCTSPLEIVAVELYAYNRAPHWLIRTILFPGACADNLHTFLLTGGRSSGTHTWANVLDGLKSVKHKEAWEQPFPSSWEMFKEQKLDLIGGSFTVAAGALISALGPAVVGSSGMAMLLLYVFREKAEVHVFMVLATLCSLAWIPLHLFFEEQVPESKDRQGPNQEPPGLAPRRLRTQGKFKVY